ncbi:hypothetical protein KIH41_17765 [Litoribacter ruber]|uniref:hypothetical protein n=1 Tax=Litoribacter ruber TaxID=702568 RepID=UPI001BD9D9F9|nr:hypothetical protein [Litoribacter ruber]MBT0813140.1 hypothetical protein [Litoribacter ruber]
MKYWIFFVIVISLSSCFDSNINTLEHERVKFKNLPNEVIHYLRNPDDYHDGILYMLIELPKGKKNNYRLETVKTWIGPWESHKKLINIKTNVYYKIDQGVPRPYIVFENNLYVPDRYNIFTTVDDLNSLEFIRYELK